MHNKPHTKETKEKLSKYFKEHPSKYWLGKKFTKEHKRKLGESHKGKIGYWRGKKRPNLHSDESKKRISEFNKGRHHTEETKRKLSLLRRGDKNPNWAGGISYESYPINWTRILKRSIRERDHYICQKCSQYGNFVHHIDYDKKNCNPDNLITLCNGCNLRVNKNREKWTRFFQEKQS